MIFGMDIKMEMRICRVCGIEKLISEFGLAGKYHRRVCKRCRYRMRANRNKEACGFTKNIRARAIAKREYEESRNRNLELYGHATTPRAREIGRINDKKYRATNKALYGITRSPKEIEADKRRYRKLRLLAMQLYGGQCECCGESQYRFLTFDHINPDGKTPSNINGLKLVRAALTAFGQHGYPNSKYRILCFNCNESIGHYGYCSHNGQPTNIIPSKYALQRRVAKAEMIAEYGGKCKLCGEVCTEFLTIDHINNNGSQHRKEIGIATGGIHLYRWLKRQGWPKDNYRLLCFNCNLGSETRSRRGGYIQYVSSSSGEND